MTDNPIAGRRELQEEALTANRRIVEAGLVVLTFGNASVADRRAGLMAIKPSGVAYSDLRPESMVLVDIETGAVAGGDYRPSSDTPTHLVLYRAFEGIGGIVHAHSSAATSWAQAGRPIPCLGTTHADHFRGPVPVTRELTEDEIRGGYEAETGRVIVETIDAHRLAPLEIPAILVRSHGPFTWGRNGGEAAENAIALEAVAKLALQTLALSPAIEKIGGALVDRHFLRKHGPAAYYGQARGS